MRRQLAAIVAAIGIATTLAGCSSPPGTDIGGNSVKKGTESPSPTTSSKAKAMPTTSVSMSSVPTKAAGPEVFHIGEPATVTQNGQEAGEITVEDVSRSKQPADPSLGEPPKHGEYVTVTIRAVARGSETFDINPLDFYLRDSEGNRYGYGEGNAIMESPDNALDATTLNPGEKVRGAVVFDAPRNATELVYAPFDQALGVFDLRK